MEAIHTYILTYVNTYILRYDMHNLSMCGAVLNNAANTVNV